MRNSTEMTNRLRQLHELYDGDDGQSREPDLTPDERVALEQELKTFREMKALLDQRPTRSPDQAAVSAVLAAARGETVYSHSRSSEAGSVGDEPPTSADQGVRQDRPPVSRRRSTILRIGATSALLVVLLTVVGILQFELWDPQVSPATTDADVPAASESPSTADAERVMPPADRVPSEEPQGRSDSQSEPSARDVPSAPIARSQEAADAIASNLDGISDETEAADPLSWDSRSDVMEVFEHIEMISGGDAQDWDSSPIPLEMLTDDDARGEPFLHQAGQRRP